MRNGFTGGYVLLEVMYYYLMAYILQVDISCRNTCSMSGHVLLRYLN